MVSLQNFTDPFLSSEVCVHVCVVGKRMGGCVSCHLRPKGRALETLSELEMGPYNDGHSVNGCPPGWSDLTEDSHRRRGLCRV